MSDVKRREELGDFLRTRRERLSPGEVGLPASDGTRRRAKGLRREEVAALAGISLPWYTSLEQGRDIRVSEGVLDSLARTLRLTVDERIHMYKLADQRLPAIPREAYTEPDLRALQPMLDRLDPFPAYVADRRMNAAAWNRAAAELFGAFDGVDERERNLVWRMFTRADYPAKFPDWEEAAHSLLSQFRTRYAKHLDDGWYAELARELSERNPRFREWWSEHSVQCVQSGEGVLSQEGQERYIAHVFFLAHSEDAMLTVYVPAGAGAAPEAAMFGATTGSVR
ncbi:MAG TPA: helix-turn-helix transcriptional regulator [Paenibacillus sp.]|nr:helix-turn-helix transcriptional regulator [Paenibacillus sp.]